MKYPSRRVQRFQLVVIFLGTAWLIFLAGFLTARADPLYPCGATWVRVGAEWVLVALPCPPPISGVCGGCHAETTP